MGIARVGPGRYRVKARCRVGGRIRQAQRTIKGTHEDAQAEAVRLKALLRADGSFSERKRGYRTFAQLCELYRKARPAYSASRLRLLRIMEDALGAWPLAQVPTRLKVWMAQTRERGREMLRTRGVGMVKAVYNVAVDEGIVRESPIHGKAFRTVPPSGSKRVLTPVEQDRLRAACVQVAPWLLPLVEYALEVPIRITEALCLSASDVDLVNRRAHVRDQTAKGERGSVKPVTPGLVAHMATLPGDVVFHNGHGKRLSRISPQWGRVVKAAGLPGLRFHALRHTAVTRLLDGGLPASQVASLAGWATSRMLRTYYHGATLEAVQAFHSLPGKSLDDPRCEHKCENIEPKNREI